jgi:hypothetical protein
VTFEQLAESQREEIRRLIREASGESARELREQVHARFSFVLCTECRREFVRDPMGKERRGG